MNRNPLFVRCAAGAALLAATLLASTPASASPELAKAKNCLSCHQIDKKLLGPAYKDVAARYANDKDAEVRLAKKIREGGSGAWGTLPMPANPQVSADEARTLAHWILSLK